MAHIVASITVFVNAPPLYLPQCLIVNLGLPILPCSLPENGGQQVMFFLASSCLTPNKDLLYLIRNKVDY